MSTWSMCGPNFLRFRVSRDNGMRVLILAVTAIGVLSGVAPASAEPGPSALAYPPPFIDHADLDGVVFWPEDVLFAVAVL